MTADSTIRAALEAAAARLRRPWPTFDTRGMTAEQQRDRAHNLAAAAAIAEFLTGMAEALDQGSINDMVTAHYLRDYAAAVTAAGDGA